MLSAIKDNAPDIITASQRKTKVKDFPMHMQNHIKYDLANQLTELAGNLAPWLYLSTTVGSKVHASCQDQ